MKKNFMFAFLMFLGLCFLSGGIFLGYQYQKQEKQKKNLLFELEVYDYQLTQSCRNPSLKSQQIYSLRSKIVDFDLELSVLQPTLLQLQQSILSLEDEIRTLKENE